MGGQQPLQAVLNQVVDIRRVGGPRGHDPADDRLGGHHLMDGGGGIPHWLRSSCDGRPRPVGTCVVAHTGPGWPAPSLLPAPRAGKPGPCLAGD